MKRNETSPSSSGSSLKARLRHFFLVLGVWVLVLFIFWGLGEAAIRILSRNGSDFTLEMWKYARFIKRISPDPLIGHGHRPGSRAHLMGVDVAINARGLRDRDFANDKPPHTVRVMMLGDSETFGWGVPQNQTTPKVVEELLNRNAPGKTRFEVINSGVGNYNTQMEVRYFLTEGYKYQPDLVTLNYVFNDAEETPHYQGNFLNEHSQLWVWLGGRLDVLLRRMGRRGDWNTYYSGLYREDAPGWRNAREWMSRLAEYCRSRDIPLILVNHPELRVLEPYPFHWLNKKLEELADRLGMGFIELYDAVKGEPPQSLWVTVPDPHPNAHACLLFGQAIFERLKDQIYRLDR